MTTAAPGAKLGGRIKEIAERAMPAVDLIVSGHSHFSYECTVNDPAGHRRLVTRADSFGRSFTDLRFDLNRAGDVVRGTVRATFRPVPVDTARQPAMAELVETWRARSEDVANRVVGHITADMPGRGSTLPETPLGSFLADAQVAAGKPQGADRLLADTVRIDGRPLSPDTTYKVALNEFLANGGNGFTVFGDITAREGGEVTDLDALVTRLETTTSATSPAAPPAPGRITFVAR
ncbi:5'-nucleotidase C-terminal domain-containing protein [Streptomyces wedmorensis]